MGVGPPTHLTTLLAFLASAQLAWAGNAPRRAPDPPSRPQAAPTAATSASRTAAPTTSKDLKALLRKADDACQAFDLETCIRLSQDALKQPDITSDDQVRLHANLGSAYAVLGDPTASVASFRLLLRLQPDYALPNDAPPKITVIFQSVQADEARLRQATQAAERKRLKEGVTVELHPPPQAQGGTPLRVEAAVASKMGGLARVALYWRRSSDAPFAIQPMVPGAAGVFEHVFEGQQTASTTPSRWEMYAAALAEDGDVLKTSGSAERPLVVTVAAGEVARPSVFRQPWFWGATLGPAAALLAVVVVGGVMVLGAGAVAAWLYSIQPPQGAQGTQVLGR